MIKIYLLLLAGMLTACGSTPPPRPPQAREQAQLADKDGRRALKSGELINARHNFIKALATQQSLDDRAGAATTIINLATLSHQMHDDEAALNWLDKILLEKERFYPAETRMNASFRKAVILTNQARLGEANAALRTAENICEAKCSLRFSMAVLQARWLLLRGNAEAALTQAKALAQERDAGKEEQANALRIAAAAEEKLARYEAALPHYQAAFELDKTLALAPRIAEDLEGMARTAKHLGQEDDAANYARRAELVQESLRQK